MIVILSSEHSQSFSVAVLTGSILYHALSPHTVLYITNVFYLFMLY